MKKVITAIEMRRLEEQAVKRGASEERFMEEAGRKVAECVMAFVEKTKLPKRATLLVGKGNKGGDAFAAGFHLLEEGFDVQAVALYPFAECTALNQKMHDRFRKHRGKVTTEVGFNGVIIDGLLGTGFKGKVDEKLNALIREVNASGHPIIAIDLPSGLDGTTGEVGGVAVVATETVTLGLAKIGLFIREGWNYAGKVHVADFGLPSEGVEKADAVAYLPEHVALPKIVRTRHKYEAGYVVGYGGSKDLVGAGQLTAAAALKSGAGIVRLFSPDRVGTALLLPELIANVWSSKAWNEAIKKAKAIFVGPGLGKSKKAAAWLKKHVKNINLPVVFDADALEAHLTYPKNAILTPHRGEALRLLGLKGMPREEELFAKVIRFCNDRGVYVVLKGAPTFVFAPKRKPVIICEGDPGMATAGSGDVLTGLLASLLAQGCSPYVAALLGCTLHGKAGEFAAEKKTSYCMTATDIVECLPMAFSSHGTQ